MGRRLDARVNAHTVKLYWRGELIKVHPVVAPGRRHTDPADLPAEVSAYAMRDLNTVQRKASAHGDHVGTYAAAVLEHPLPWTKMRQVYRLLGLVRRHGADAVDDACRRALDAEVINVGLIDRMCSRGTGEQLPLIPASPPTASRFVRDPANSRRSTARTRTLPASGLVRMLGSLSVSWSSSRDWGRLRGDHSCVCDHGRQYALSATS